MKHQKRIAEAFVANGIQRILFIDDVYDAPALDDDVPGTLTDFLQSGAGRGACFEAGLALDEVDAAEEAALNGDVQAEALSRALEALYSKFALTRDERFDPGHRFETLKGVTLDALAPLVALLGSCGDDVDIRFAGLSNSEEVFREHNPQVVLLDYFLGPDVPVGGDGSPDNTHNTAKARKQAIDLLTTLLRVTDGDDPAIVLMSSAAVEGRAERFRQDVEAGGARVLALRFRFLRKGWIRQEAREFRISSEAADALLDTSQGFVFGQVLQRALLKWRLGAEKAIEEFHKEIGGLEPKDFAYLFRFRLLTEGERMSDYLEWMFGENLRALVDEHVEWRDISFERLDEPELSEGIEGAFDGPSARIATIFHRIRIDEHRSRPPRRHALGDIYVAKDGDRVRAVITPDCDLVVRNGRTKVRHVLTMGGELRSFDQESASADQFIFRGRRPYSLKWDPKDLQTFPVEGAGSLSVDPNYAMAGTLRPLYAQEMQRQTLTDLSRVGLAVAPAMGVDAIATTWLRVAKGGGTVFKKLDFKANNIATLLLERSEARSGHKVLLRRSFVHALIEELLQVDPTTLEKEDADRLAEFLREKNEDQLIRGFLIAGSLTRDKGPLGSRISIGRKPDSKRDSPWLQLLLELSPEAMEELLTVNPLLQLAQEQMGDPPRDRLSRPDAPPSTSLTRVEAEGGAPPRAGAVVTQDEDGGPKGNANVVVGSVEQSWSIGKLIVGMLLILAIILLLGGAAAAFSGLVDGLR